jgi:hypothetical protein
MRLKINDLKLEVFDFKVLVKDKKIYLRDNTKRELILIKNFSDLIYCLNSLKYKYIMEQDSEGVMIEFDLFENNRYTFLSDKINFNLIDYRY